MFGKKKKAQSEISVSSEVKVRDELQPTRLRPRENVTLCYALTVDYLTVELDKEGEAGIRKDLKAKMARKVDEFMDSITLED